MSPPAMGLRVVTAHHEAGHAVVAMRLGWDVLHIVLEGGMGSGVTCMDPPDAAPDWRDDVTIRLAGRAAEVRLLGSVSTLSFTAEDERAEAIATAREALGHDEPAERELSALDARVGDILGVERHWEAVLAIGASLSKWDLFPKRELEAIQNQYLT